MGGEVLNNVKYMKQMK